MPKITASDKHRNNKFVLSSSKLQRAPIHRKAEDEEDDCDEENVSESLKSLYPSEDIEKDLQEIKGKPVRYKTEGIPVRQPPERPSKIIDGTDKSSDSINLKYILVFLITIVLAIFGFCYSNNQSEKPAADKTISLTKFISDMEKKFEGQDPQTFRILKSSLKKVFDENSKPATPSIITVITNKGAETKASDFGAYIAQELATRSYVSINESHFRRNADSLKYEIDTEIKSKFNNRSLNVAVVDRFHNIPIGAAMIFHSYCDNDTASFKRAVFLFIVHLDRKIPEKSSPKFVDTAAMEALRSIWRDASDDVVDSLITRLTVNVINIK